MSRTYLLRERLPASRNIHRRTILCCDGELWRAGGWLVHRVRALVKTTLSIALESGGAGNADDDERTISRRTMEPGITAAGVVLVAESEARERSRTLSVRARKREREKERAKERERDRDAERRIERTDRAGLP